MRGMSASHIGVIAGSTLSETLLMLSLLERLRIHRQTEQPQSHYRIAMRNAHYPLQQLLHLRASQLTLDPPPRKNSSSVLRTPAADPAPSHRRRRQRQRSRASTRSSRRLRRSARSSRRPLQHLRPLRHLSRIALLPQQLHRHPIRTLQSALVSHAVACRPRLSRACFPASIAADRATSTLTLQTGSSTTAMAATNPSQGLHLKTTATRCTKTRSPSIP